MPIQRGTDSHGPFFQWGTQKKYYYKPNNKKSRELAKEKARKQMVAIYASGWRN